jgi:hypothetical protein
MAFTNKLGAPIQVIGGVNIEAAAVAGALTPSGSTFQHLTAAGAMDLTLPAEADSNGLWYMISAFTSTITVKDDGGATISTVATTKMAVVACDGAAWVQMFIQT